MSDDEKTHTENAEAYRAKAAEAAETVRTVRSLKQGSEARKSQKAYKALADNEDWLAKNAYLIQYGVWRVAPFLQTFKEFPPSQRSASFSIDQMVDEYLKVLLG